VTWHIVLPALFALGFWWFATGAILYIDGLPRHTFKWSLSVAGVLWMLALWGLWATAGDTSVRGAYVAFSCSLLVWGWHEMAFLMGLLTGPRRSACPPGAQGWARVQYAVQAVLYHELALVAQLGLLCLMLQDAANPVGWWTFGVLWLMRLSAKLNVFLGVRNLNEQWLPVPLKYLHSYFRQRPANGLFPLSAVLIAAAAVATWQGAAAASTDTFHGAALSFVATLFTLALLEHLLMVLPLSADALWGWAWRSRVTPVE
jgi:putative photosynthetic complex assembly protein 2